VKGGRPVHPAWALAALTGLNLFNYLDRQVLPAVLTPLKQELHLSDRALGMLSVAFMLGYFATAPVFGYLGDRVSRKGLILGGVVVWSLGTVLSGWAPNFVSLLLFRVLVGLGEASYGSISPGWIADLYAPGRRNLRISIFYTAIPVGSALGYILGGFMAAHFGWHAAFLWAGAPGLLLALSLLFLREPARGASEAGGPVAYEPAPASNENPLRSLLRTYARLRGHPDYLLVVAGYVAQTFSMGAFAFWGPTFLSRAHGMGVEQAGRFFGGWLVLTGLLATFLGGAVATALSRRSPAGYARLLGLSAIATVPATLAAFAFTTRGPAEVALVAAMFLIFLPTGPLNTLILETVPVGLRACAMAASIFAIHLFGDLWSPALVGFLSDRFGSLREAVLWTLPAGMAVCALLWSWLAVRQARRAA
jgi:MFS transporter, Spinster family, sphingosine-1-phosphate transporter